VIAICPHCGGKKIGEVENHRSDCPVVGAANAEAQQSLENARFQSQVFQLAALAAKTSVRTGQTVVKLMHAAALAWVTVSGAPDDLFLKSMAECLRDYRAGKQPVVPKEISTLQ
jgi:hypothetical protein